MLAVVYLAILGVWVVLFTAMCSILEAFGVEDSPKNVVAFAGTAFALLGFAAGVVSGAHAMGWTP